ncbi:MAG: putative unusual protein kinase regulating ubiquinone biosynthesis (AarF/ABC1/UbiB family) [Polyangiales bacterium]|jgi:predicted unusual protein kinase regulating ubiquinone biosynthesis (AarF/ABC1/UbiB family)
MRKLWHMPARFLLVFTTMVPIYFSYLWLYVRGRHFGSPPSDESFRRAHVKNAARFYRTAVRMRGGLIKVGQIISTRVDIVPDEWLKAMAPLQDKVTPTPWRRIRPHLERELGGDPDTIFETVTHEAVAAASFGQVHRARLKDGRDVAVKVRYPDVEMKLQCDLAAMRIAVPLFNRFVPKVPLKNIYNEISQALSTELDYEQEARFTEIIEENMRPVASVVVPHVIREHTSNGVICTEFFEGMKITDREAIDAAGLDVHDIVQKVMRAYATMFFIDGVFQSDPHPGNLLVRKGEDGTAEVCVLDFGQSKILPKDFHSKLVRSAFAFMVRDVDGFSNTVVELGILSERDVELARPLLREFFEELFELTPEELKELDVSGLKAQVLVFLDKMEGVVIPQDIVLYGRAFSLLAGVVTQLAPNINGFVLAGPIIMQALAQGTKAPAASDVSAPVAHI